MLHSLTLACICSPSSCFGSRVSCEWLGLGKSEYFKITFVIAHQIGDQILEIVECNQIALCLYLLALNLNTNKPIDINEY